MKLDTGKVAVITGGASGIGYAVAAGLAMRGLRLVLADIEPNALGAAAAELRQAGATVIDRVVDVRHMDEVQALAGVAHSQFGHVDLLLNNAGVVSRRSLLWEQEESDWHWVTEVNYYGVLNGIRSFVPDMIDAGRGHVVNTASIHGLGDAGGGYGPYAGTKHAVVGVSEHLRFELDRVAPQIGVTILCPGAVETRIRDASRNRPPEYEAPSAPGGTWDSGLERPLTRVPVEDVVGPIIDGIEHGLLYLPVAPQVTRYARERIQRLLGGLAAAEELSPQWNG